MERNKAFKKYETMYVTDKDNCMPIRYDVITMSDDIFHVKYFIEKTDSNGTNLIHVDEFEILRSDYNNQYRRSGFQKEVRFDMSKPIERFIKDKIQEHRNKLNLTIVP